LANGGPIGLALAKPQLPAELTGLTISTSRSPTAARAVPDFIEEHNLRANGREAGAYLRGRLAELRGKHEVIGDVHGMALSRPRAG
jgi:4-aminobutyrate aminotransferase-like enzyme